MSSEGPLISDFVTHESSFNYSTYGIHIGQDDRLTFMGDNGKYIHGHFVDCREGSPTLHHHVAIAFAPSVYRRLIVPRGVAHTFDNIERIVTRDEPI
ncbi:dTDP-4-dehydrorhamnose 3,5-epimerase family protein [Bartonella pachyuromydis]|uniref:dTDP-4-dehydrorhamnose 3,5-epimerase n=1 Tax=Bartonella pachyuromydis TaxID=931097 RepID=A0ABP8VE95_9HYPH